MVSQRSVSVVVPTYYRNDRLREALDSLERTVYDRIETIIVDDSGERHARPIVEEYDWIDYIALPDNRGQNAALNRGLEAVTGDYVQFLDDDDEVMPGKFVKQVELLESSPDIGVTYCGIETGDGEVHLPSAEGRGDVLEKVLTFDLQPCVTSTMLFDAGVLDRITPLPTPPGSTDIYMKIELAQRTRFDYVNEPLVRKRDSADGVGSSAAAIEGNRAVFEEYSDVYNQFDASVRRTALASFYNRAGRFYLSEHRWSPRAMSAFGKAVYYAPGLSIPYLSRLLGSVFGRTGVRIAEWGMTEAVAFGSGD